MFCGVGSSKLAALWQAVAETCTRGVKFRPADLGSLAALWQSVLPAFVRPSTTSLSHEYRVLVIKFGASSVCAAFHYLTTEV